jgi:hypothetical protein
MTSRNLRRIGVLVPLLALTLVAANEAEHGGFGLQGSLVFAE